jgi:hypothetical protein
MGHIEALDAAEEAAFKLLGAKLTAHLALAGDTFNFLNAVLGAAPEIPVRQVSPSRMVTTALLLRLTNDLRCVGYLAPRGYELQAVSLVAPMYEAAYTMVVIGANDEMAQRWIEHDDPTQTFYGNIKTLTLDGLKKLEHRTPEEQVKKEYLIYRQLCMGKHVNPLLQQQHGFVRAERTLTAVVGPMTDEQSERAGWFALEHASRLAHMGAHTFLLHHVPGERATDLWKALLDLGRRRDQLGDQATARGWDRDPTPDRWKL